MIHKLRNEGGTESWFSDAEAAALLQQPGWQKVESCEEDENGRPIKADADAPAEEPSASDDAPVDTPEEAPVAKKGKGR